MRGEVKRRDIEVDGGGQECGDAQGGSRLRVGTIGAMRVNELQDKMFSRTMLFCMCWRGVANNLNYNRLFILRGRDTKSLVSLVPVMAIEYKEVKNSCMCSTKVLMTLVEYLW